jgi:hypothetical protein
MTAGPGKYDVVGGDKGAGFAVQATPEAALDLPAALRSIASAIEAEATVEASAFKTWWTTDDD